MNKCPVLVWYGLVRVARTMVIVYEYGPLLKIEIIFYCEL